MLACPTFMAIGVIMWRRNSASERGALAAADRQRTSFPLGYQRASGRALPHDYQREQAGAKQGDARERNRQESKRCEFLTHGCVAKDSPCSDHHKSGDAQSRAAQNDDWRD